MAKGAEANGYPNDLWTLKRVAEVIERLTGVSYHPARVWYVSPTGNDAASGTIDAPVATVPSIEWQVSPGDEIHFRAGTYQLLSEISLYTSGTAAGQTLDDLLAHLKDLYADLTSGQIPGIRRVGELVIS